MSSFSKLISIRSITEKSDYTTSFFRAKNSSEREKLSKLLNSDSGILVADELRDQLKELIKIEHPTRKLTSDEIESLISEKLGDTPAEEYGVWVYYPWLRKVVHLLDEEEFIKVRTSRNQYKITAEERDLLGSKKVGVIGLSVGQSASVTMAMERTFGEIRIADFDNLELTNLNRIRTGTQNLGIPKVTMVAREIAEIDPFLKVIPYFEGITEDNIEQFFTEGGMLDLLVEECDGVDIKILAREVAKKHRVPIVMDMSDRGCLDIERYDLEEDYPLLHGFIPENVDYELMKSLETNEEKMPYLLPMVQTENLSPRMKASLLEVGQTIGTWPQLSSDVVMGGAFATNLVRRILLDQLHVSGRYYIDPDELIRDEEVESNTPGNLVNKDLQFTFLKVGESNDSTEDSQHFRSSVLENLESLSTDQLQLRVISDTEKLDSIRTLLSNLDMEALSDSKFRKLLFEEDGPTEIHPKLITTLTQNQMMQHLISSSEAMDFLKRNKLGENLKSLSQNPGERKSPVVVFSSNGKADQIHQQIEQLSEEISGLGIQLEGNSLAPLFSQNQQSLSSSQFKALSRVREELEVEKDHTILLIANIKSRYTKDLRKEEFHSLSVKPNQTSDVQI